MNETIIIDNRMEWYLETKGLSGATMDWGGDVVLCDNNGMILPYRADRIINKEFYKNGDDWPRCPITGKQIPIDEKLE